MNIAYGETFREKLDIFGDDLKPDSPLFVFIHGGYWQMYDKWASSFVAGPLVEKGIRVIVLDYELCPKVTLEEIVSQTNKSFEWISEYVRKNSIKSVSIAGHSAGGHLLACALNREFVASIPCDVKLFAYGISGVYDLRELQNLNAANENNILSLDECNVRKLSPQFFDFSYLAGRNLKFYIFAGEFESEKFKQQSKDFAENPLKGLPSVFFEIISGVDHFDIVEKLTQEDYEITKLIANNCNLN